MSLVSSCPTCGSKSKVKDTKGELSYEAIQDEEALKKVGQLKKASELVLRNHILEPCTCSNFRKNMAYLCNNCSYWVCY
ncbi:hypothetical protein SAMN06298216_0207 [Spirosomataceae bacterium TFI 002]|nr:hypothetical protein SAMN06298216_0207 [Spirosomataceae bacterium TFI 002]